MERCWPRRVLKLQVNMLSCGGSRSGCICNVIFDRARPNNSNFDFQQWYIGTWRLESIVFDSKSMRLSQRQRRKERLKRRQCWSSFLTLLVWRERFPLIAQEPKWTFQARVLAKTLYSLLSLSSRMWSSSYSPLFMLRDIWTSTVVGFCLQCSGSVYHDWLAQAEREQVIQSEPRSVRLRQISNGSSYVFPAGMNLMNMLLANGGT